MKPALRPLQGTLALPGDKSISHRRALLALLSSVPCILEHFGSGEDCASSLHCLSTLGKHVTRSGSSVEISGHITSSEAVLDCGNSGTTARLLMGILAAQPGRWTLHGDASLSKRPMERVAAPLRQMGADIRLTDGHLPAVICGKKLAGIRYDSPVVSAQVKSAVLLAGLRAHGETSYREQAATRDHTERLLNLAPDRDGWLTVRGDHNFQLTNSLSGTIPADPSAAAFWTVAASAIPDSNITFSNLLLNKHRIAFIELLQQRGTKVTLQNEQSYVGEFCGDLTVVNSTVRPLQVSASNAAAVIDEIPALAVLATQCNGRSEFHGIGELRVKESDRLNLIARNLTAMGAVVTTWDDGFSVEGPVRLKGTVVNPEHDHRIAMAFAIAGLFASGETRIQSAECAAVSYPDFWRDLARLSPDCMSLES